MRCGAGHDAPLRLISGADRRLVLLARTMAGAGLVAIFLADSYRFLEIVLAALLTLAWWWLEHRRKGEPGDRLVVYPDGRARWGGSDVRLLPRFWISRWYCVLACEGVRGTRNILVSASRQEPGEYRKLLGWLRLGNRADPEI